MRHVCTLLFGLLYVHIGTAWQLVGELAFVCTSVLLTCKSRTLSSVCLRLCLFSLADIERESTRNMFFRGLEQLDANLLLVLKASSLRVAFKALPSQFSLQTASVRWRLQRRHHCVWQRRALARGGAAVSGDGEIRRVWQLKWTSPFGGVPFPFLAARCVCVCVFLK